jgi:Protein of unknown function (DUF3572)
VTLKPTVLSTRDLADICLAYLVRNPEQLAEFMIQSGIEPKTLRGLVGTDHFSHGMIDYVVGNEGLLLAVASENQLRPETIVNTWTKLHQREA